MLAEQGREIVARKVALKSATTQAGEFVHEEIRKVRRVRMVADTERARGDAAAAPRRRASKPCRGESSTGMERNAQSLKRVLQLVGAREEAASATSP